MPETLTPPRRSAVEKRLIELGANLVERDGWRQAESFTSAQTEAEAVRNGAGLFDLSPLTKLDIRASNPAAVWPSIFPGVDPPAESGSPEGGRGGGGDRIGRAALCGRPVIYARLNPESFLLTAPPGFGPEMEAAVREAASGAGVGVTDVTSGLSVFELAGPSAAPILRKLTAVAPPAEDRRAVQARVAGAHAVIFRVDGDAEAGGPALPALRLHVTRDLGLYVWEVLEDAGDEFGITPYGIEARSRLFRNAFPG